MSNNTIIHICSDNKGGTEKYVHDLINLFPNYKHIVHHNIPFIVNNINEVILIHIHATFFESNIEWEVLDMLSHIQKNASKKIQVYLTIHDYQWLFDNKAFYTIGNREDALKYYQTYNKLHIIQLFDKVDRIFIPTQRVFDIYKYYMNNDLTLLYMNKMHIIPHSDIFIRNEQLYVPIIQSNVIHIAFVGQFNEYKGGRLFLDLIYNLLTYKNYKIEYHIFGKHTQSDHDNKLKDYVHFHGRYKNSNLIQDLYDNNFQPMTECYLGIIKNGPTKSKVFTNVESNFSYLIDYTNPGEGIKTITFNSSTEIYDKPDVGNIYDIGLYEYSPEELTETLIMDVKHNFLLNI